MAHSTKLAFLAIGIAAVAWPATSALARTGSKTVYRRDYGVEWPFPRFQTATIRCHHTSALLDSMEIVTIKLGGTEYGLNGIAMARGYPQVQMMLARDPATGGYRFGATDDLLEQGLALCH